MGIFNHMEFEKNSLNSINNFINETNPNNKKFILPAAVIGFIILIRFLYLIMHYDLFEKYDFTGYSTTYFCIAMVILCVFLLKCISLIISFIDDGIDNKKNSLFAKISFTLCIISIFALNYIAYIEDSTATNFYSELQTSMEENASKSKTNSKLEELYLKRESEKDFKIKDKFYDTKLLVANRVNNSSLLKTRLYMNFVTLKYYYYSPYDDDPMYYYGFLNIFSKIYLVSGIYFSLAKKKDIPSAIDI